MGWTSLIGLGLGVSLHRRIGLLGDAAYWQAHTRAIQFRQLRDVIERAQRTEFGRAHGFARLLTLGDEDMLRGYRAGVAHGDIAGFRPMLSRMRDAGEPDVLWPGRVTRFAQTSGTTAGDKYIPVSDEMMVSNRRSAMDIFAHASRFGVSLGRLLGGKCLFLGGSTELSVNERGIATGDLSGIVSPMIRWPLSAIYSPGPDIALMSHWPSKIEAMARLVLEQDVRMVSGMCSWQLVLFSRVIELARERGLGERTLREIWPRMELLVHGGVRYAPFDPRLREAWSGSAQGEGFPHRLELYPASEGFIAMQDTPGDPGLRLLSDVGNFYEFIPVEDADTPGARAYDVGEVEKHRRYAVVMTTCAGLYRYVIGDVVEFDTLCDGPGRTGDGPARLRIVGRHRHFINAFGENLIVENIETGVAEAARDSQIRIGEFTACPVYPDAQRGRRASIELVIEVAGEPDRARLEHFARVFDDSLQRQATDYGIKRTSGVGLAPPVITPVPMGAVHAWMGARGKLGGQHKCPRCANHRDYAEGVLGAAGIVVPAAPSTTLV